METVAFAMDTLIGFNRPIFCTFGQHDTPYHIAEGMQPLYREKNLNPEILSNKFVSDKKY
jgi:hypothetical protein